MYDIIDGYGYTHEMDTLNLVLFIDAAVLAKSSNKSMTAFFSTIVELPPNLRHSYENVLFHSSWYGSTPDYNTFLEKFNAETNDLFENGLMYNGKHLKIKGLLFIADGILR